MDLFSGNQATLSPCGTYRYWLRREWDAALPYAVFVMLNPSTADAEVDDPTIRRCIGFARSWGCGALEVVNLFAYRGGATDEEDRKGPVTKNRQAYRDLLRFHVRYSAASPAESDAVCFLGYKLGRLCPA